MSSMLRTIDRSITRAENLPPWRLRNQPAHAMRIRAFNHTPPVAPGLEGEALAVALRERQSERNAAKGIRRERGAAPKPGPAEQPRRTRRARYYRFASRVRP